MTVGFILDQRNHFAVLLNQELHNIVYRIPWQMHLKKNCHFIFIAAQSNADSIQKLLEWTPTNPIAQVRLELAYYI